MIIVQPGGFRTNLVRQNKEAVGENKVHAHPAYDNEALPVYQMAQIIQNPEILNKQFMKGDPEKFVSVLFRLADMEDVPFRVPLTDETWMMKDAKEKKAKEDEEKFNLRDWSKDLTISD